MNAPLSFQSDNPQILASIHYIQEMNTDMLNTIWPEGEITFPYTTKEWFMEQLDIFFDEVKSNGEVSLQFKAGKFKTDKEDDFHSVYFFFSPVTKRYINFQFMVRQGSIYEIDPFKSYMEEILDGYIDWKFWFYERVRKAKTTSVDNTMEQMAIKHILLEYHIVNVWELENLLEFFVKCWEIFSPLDLPMDNVPDETLQFTELTIFMSGIVNVFYNKKQIETALQDWKVANLMNDRKMKFAVFFEYNDLLSGMLLHSYTIENNAFVYYDGNPEDKIVIRLNKDVSFAEEFLELMRNFRKYHNDIQHFCEKEECFNGSVTLDELLDLKKLVEFRKDVIKKRKDRKG